MSSYHVHEGYLVMDMNRITGFIKQIVGAVRETVGKLLGDHKTESEGRAEKAEGKVLNAIGGLKDTARGIVDKE
jgi:uncharacterized protein YjbJ (UPF0337 family)